MKNVSNEKGKWEKAYLKPRTTTRKCFEEKSAALVALTFSLGAMYFLGG